MGIYYEQLWHFLFEVWRTRSDVELITHNLQVQKAGVEPPETLGEYDLIYRIKEQFYHRELAIKFYLGMPSATEKESSWNQWVGPGLKDRLDHKMQRLTGHQINLSDTTEGSQALRNLGISQVNKEILVQGRLFYPFPAPCPPPTGANPNHLRGTWLTLGQLERWLSQQDSNTTGQFVKKPFWLNNEHNYDALNPEQLLKILPDQSLPAMLKFQEDYFFVVPDHWPEHALAYSRQ